MPVLIAGIVAAIAGLGIGWVARDQKGKKNVANAEVKAADILKKAEAKEQDVMVRAKDKAVKILEDARKEEKQAIEEVKKQQALLVERETVFSTKLIEVEEQKKKLEADTARKEEELKKIEELKATEITKLEEVAGLRREEALTRIMNLVEEQNADTVLSRMRKLDEQDQDEIDKKAKNILAVAIQRQASSHAHETLTSYVEIPGDEMKGRVIGREGRNIKAIEQLTGCELVVDDTPGMITISGFSPIRRQVAKRALASLIKDGRIHPGRIEEAVEEAKRDLAIDIKKAGEDALFELGISMAGIDPKLIQILGRLKYRTSYGQNALQHSMEVSRLATIIAEELGADVMVCKKGGLFHDIGKAVDHDMQGGHPELGYQILKKFGFPEEICYQSLAHHEDKPHTVEAVIIKAADAISGARPGARKDSLELYVKRLEDIEAAAQGFAGVDKVYAIQAGREVRVFVNPTQIDDLQAEKLARDIALKLEQELKYPGEIRVTLIREKRVVEYAR
jgi:ribonucrease Y